GRPDSDPTRDPIQTQPNPEPKFRIDSPPRGERADGAVLPQPRRRARARAPRPPPTSVVSAKTTGLRDDAVARASIWRALGPAERRSGGLRGAPPEGRRPLSAEDCAVAVATPRGRRSCRRAGVKTPRPRLEADPSCKKGHQKSDQESHIKWALDQNEKACDN